MKLKALSLGCLFILIPSILLAETHKRDSWYVGFGIGGGLNKYFYFPDETSHYDNWLSGTQQYPKITTNFKIGGTINPYLLFGLDVTTMDQEGNLSGTYTYYSARISITNTFAMFTYFPYKEGFFLRAGGGFSILEATRSGFLGEAYMSMGYGGLAGIGYAFWFGKSFNISINMDHSRQFYTGNDAGYDRSQFTSIYLGFDWY